MCINDRELEAQRNTYIKVMPQNMLLGFNPQAFFSFTN